MNFVDDIEAKLEKRLPAKTERSVKMSGKVSSTEVENILLGGKRLSIDTFSEGSNKEVSELYKEKELVDVPYLLDMRYAEYNDWR